MAGETFFRCGIRDDLSAISPCCFADLSIAWPIPICSCRSSHERRTRTPRYLIGCAAAAPVCHSPLPHIDTYRAPNQLGLHLCFDITFHLFVMPHSRTRHQRHLQHIISTYRYTSCAQTPSNRGSFFLPNQPSCVSIVVRKYPRVPLAFSVARPCRRRCRRT